MRADVDTDELVALTQALVAVDTRNPPGNERAVAGVCRRALAPYGATVTEVEPAEGRLSLLASVAHPNGAAARPTLIVNGHLDVVPVHADFWSRPPFDPVVSEGRLYGRGSADMKGGIAAAICALGALARSGRVAGCDVVFHLVADEERGGTLGTRVLAERGLIQGDACLVPEPTSLSVCVAERGLLVVDVTIRGRPGHGSRPREGVSAIEHAAVGRARRARRRLRRPAPSPARHPDRQRRRDPRRQRAQHRRRVAARWSSTAACLPGATRRGRRGRPPPAHRGLGGQRPRLRPRGARATGRPASSTLTTRSSVRSGGPSGRRRARSRR